jgi:hypothetical protein
MAVGNNEHVLILTDTRTLEVGKAIADASENISHGNVSFLNWRLSRVAPPNNSRLKSWK